MFNSFIAFLLLSNSITSRRDKSILYSIISIVLLILTIIIYDNLSILLLANNTGRVVEVFYNTVTINYYFIFILLTTSIILLLKNFYAKKVWLKEYIIWPNKFLVISTISHIGFLLLELKFYIGDPTILFSSSNLLKGSSFYRGKGKQKAENNSSEISDKHSDSGSDSFSDLYTKSEDDLDKARTISRLPNKPGESSNTNLSTYSPTETTDIYSLANNIQLWKIYTDRFKIKARDYNDRKEKLEKEGNNDPKEIEKLNVSKEITEEMKIRIAKIQLLLGDVDPHDQYPPSTTSSGSDYSSDDSYSSSEIKSNKKVKYQDFNTRSNFIILFSTLNFGLYRMLVIRFLSIMFTVIYLFIIEFSLCPNIYISIVYIKISITQLLSIVFIKNLIKLCIKWKDAIINLYYSYLYKDYFVIYTNVYISVIIILIYLGDFNDIYTLYI
uniref:NADH dehydrogenase subunit 2 n=1 Tax=Edenia gomezpompae TaxID=461172 RepID=UPI001D10C7DB|nr:NADH dehydrogenase subunit 2 [Edenia gomezpompae]UAJ48656.1 NADH dehydrogenase subunit 2 [Edenia gomezpompae]